MIEEKTWTGELLKARSKKELNPTVQKGFDPDRYKDGWLKEREYTDPNEIIKDIEYIVYEYAEKGSLDVNDLDMYFYKREYLQKKLDELYADEYVLVDKFEKPKMSFKYGSGAEEVITKLAEKMDCYVVLRKGNRWFAEVGDDIVELGGGPYINRLEEDE